LIAARVLADLRPTARLVARSVHPLDQQYVAPDAQHPALDLVAAGGGGRPGGW
jgi:hypothetical protein